jgi:hypothetical protein
MGARRIHSRMPPLLCAPQHATTEATAARESLESRLSIAQGRLLTADERLLATTEACAAWETKARAWAERETALVAQVAAAEDTLNDTTKQLKMLRENAGASEESALERLATTTRELDGTKRRLRELVDLRKRLAAEEAQGEEEKEEVHGGKAGAAPLSDALTPCIVRLAATNSPLLPCPPLQSHASATKPLPVTWPGAASTTSCRSSRATSASSCASARSSRPTPPAAGG